MPGSFTLEVREDQRAFFKANGFLSVDAITTPDELAWLREIYEPLVDDARALKLHFETTRADGTPGDHQPDLLARADAPGAARDHLHRERAPARRGAARGRATRTSATAA